METHSAPQFTIEEMMPDDIEQATAMRLASWLDTYPNDAHGVSREWVEARNSLQRSTEKQAARRARFTEGKANGTFMGWVARNESGAVIGSTTPFVDEEGTQHVGSLYVDKDWHGKGVSKALMQNVIDWFDSTKPIELGVVDYNERAKAFYRKWGFVEVEGSKTLFDNTIPEVKMIRMGGK